MTTDPRIRSLARRLRQWLRSVRGRLVATYVIAAILLAAGGVTLFVLTLDQSLRSTLDAGLQSRADALAGELGRDGVYDSIDPTPQIVAGHSDTVLQSISGLYNPSGTLVQGQPSILPAAPLDAAHFKQATSGLEVWTTHYAGEKFRLLAEPVVRVNGTWVAVVGESLDSTSDASSEVQHALLITVPVLLIFIGVGAWLVSGSALKPVDRMSADAQALSEHDPAGRITEPNTSDSLNHLARTFNALLGRLHGSLDRQRSLVADAGHELRTPLAVLQTELETAVRPTRTREDLVDSIGHARAEVSRLAVLAEDLLLLAQADGGGPIVRRYPIDLTEVVDGALAARRQDIQAKTITLRVDQPDAIIADLDPVAVRRILDNLLTNAVRHTPADGVIDVWVRDFTSASTGRTESVGIRVRDSGPGFDPKFLPHAFDRFARADHARTRATAIAGTGLGLAIVDALARAHGGSAKASNAAASGGAVVDVALRTS